ncbi:putative ubiquitin-like-specific protease 1B isoform X2 [Panicum virgatum]|uniref:putative ubiquitin-like-specific protease 1B isoform X2 n=1 Tax=Panicum virgatum TaxID=38727 RepID=UPI0019D4EF0E|nr:putative ubiquitin-like-specific protease 1B isoform X2 [Panicum virgatum]
MALAPSSWPRTPLALSPNRRKRRPDASSPPHHFHGPQSHSRLSQRLRRWFPLPPQARSFAFDMGNFVSGLIGGRRPKDDGLGLFKSWYARSRDLTVVTDEETGTAPRLLDRRVKDSRKAALEAAKPQQRQKSDPYYKKELKEARRNDGRLEEIGIEVKLIEEKLAEIRKLDKAVKEDFSELFERLTEEEQNEVNNCFNARGPSSKVLVLHEPSNIEISKEKFQCFRPGRWLNDELACGKNGYDYKSVKRWTTHRKLGYELIECDKIFFPVHKDVHWCLAIINMKENTFQYLDSLGGTDHNVLNMLARYIAEEVNDKSNKVIDTSSWHEEIVDDIPLQQNGWDCGMFMLKYIDFHSRGLNLSFNQEDMEYFRKRIAKEILKLRAD